MTLAEEIKRRPPHRKTELIAVAARALHLRDLDALSVCEDVVNRWELEEDEREALDDLILAMTEAVHDLPE